MIFLNMFLNLEARCNIKSAKHTLKRKKVKFYVNQFLWKLQHKKTNIKPKQKI